jgi:tellurite resistance protein TerC
MENTQWDQIPVWGWAVFGILVIIMLAVDLFAHRGDHPDSRKSAVIWSIIWVGLGLLFNVFVWIVFGSQAAQEYLAAYLIEKSLSLDNLFVFLIIFQTLRIPKRYQHDVLFWGILGALVFRGIFIFLGAAAIERWEWVSYIFGAILLYAAYRIFVENPAEEEENKTVKWLSQHLPVTHSLHGEKFIVKLNGRRVVTPLFIALAGLELTDVMFAVDSVPAAFAISLDPFILYSSNIFAILGLRSLYLVLAHTIAELKYLHYGLAGVLAFAAFKLMFDWLIHIPELVSVGLIVLMIGVAVWASLREREMAVAPSQKPAQSSHSPGARPAPRLSNVPYTQSGDDQQQ